MNRKLIDAALAAYEPVLDQADNDRLSFFRAVWEEQAAVAECGDTAAYQVPGEADLRAWAGAGEPVFLHAPVQIEADALGCAMQRVAQVLAQRGGFPSSTAQALERTNWERMAAASDMKLAGSDPSAFVEGFVQLLEDDGMTQDQARTGALAASLALRALLDQAAAATSKALRAAGAGDAHTLRCPVCGGQAVLARVGDTDGSHGRGKELWCSQCGTAWSFQRVRCGRCGTQNQGHLHYYNVEGDEAHRIATCDECGGYVRTVYQQDALAPFAFEVEDVVMARLDLIAYQRAAADAAQAS